MEEYWKIWFSKLTLKLWIGKKMEWIKFILLTRIETFSGPSLVSRTGNVGWTKHEIKESKEIY